MPQGDGFVLTVEDSWEGDAAAIEAELVDEALEEYLDELEVSAD